MKQFIKNSFSILLVVVLLALALLSCHSTNHTIHTETTDTNSTPTETESETEMDTQPKEDIDDGGNVITGALSYERLSQDASALTYTVSTQANARLFDAFGCEWDPHYFREYNQALGCDEEQWELIKSRIATLGVQKVRMMILPGWYEPDNDNNDATQINWPQFKFDSEEFQGVLKYLDVCEEYGVSVNLTIWGVNLGGGPSMSWLAYSSCGDWISAPTNHEEFAENVSALLQYLIREKHYTCIKELTLYNEPDWAYKGENGTVSFDDYASLCHVVDARLRADGIRDDIKLILSDNTDTSGVSMVDNYGWLSKSLTNLDDIADGYNTHVYAFNASSIYERIYKWATAQNKLVSGKVGAKPYTHNEFGSNQAEGAYYQKDIDTYARGIFLSEMAEATLNSGSSGMLYWVLHDIRYNGSPVRRDALMELGLFASVEDEWRVRPIYHAWGLIMKHTTPGSQVYSISDGKTAAPAVALKAPDGRWTYIVTNTTSKPQVVTIENTQIQSQDLDVFLYSESTVTLSDTLIASGGIAWTENGTTYLYLPAQSFAVLEETK